jgi:hypothetical protein
VHLMGAVEHGHRPVKLIANLFKALSSSCGIQPAHTSSAHLVW